MKCLLVIDMQKTSFSKETPRFNSEIVCQNINKLSDYFHRNNQPVIFIQHNGIDENFCIPNTIEWEILDELNVHEEDIIIEKKYNDSFYKSKLDQTLKELNVTEIYITGCATDFCVNSTLQTAFTKDYKLIVVSDGHTTTDRPAMAAENIIEYFHYIWKELFPINGEIEINSTDSIII